MKHVENADVDKKAVRNQEEIICPHCGERFRLYKLLVESDSGFTPPVVFSTNMQEEEIQKYFCPKCHLRIPYEFLFHKTYFLSFLGVSSSGKSHILATMSEEMKKKEMRPEDIDCIPILDARFGAEEDLNCQMRSWQDRLFRPKDEELRMLPRTDNPGVATEGDSAMYDEINGIFYPRPFIFKFWKKREEEKKRSKTTIKEHLEELLVHPFAKPFSKKSVSEDGLEDEFYFCFLDIAGEYCQEYREFNLKKREVHHVRWPLTLEGHFRLLIFDPDCSRGVLSLQNRTLDANQEVTNNVVFGTLTTGDRTHTIVLISKFDLILDIFLTFLKKHQPNKLQKFTANFKNGILPSLEDIRACSELLREFVQEADPEYMNSILDLEQKSNDKNHVHSRQCDGMRAKRIEKVSRILVFPGIQSYLGDCSDRPHF